MMRSVLALDSRRIRSLSDLEGRVGSWLPLAPHWRPAIAWMLTVLWATLTGCTASHHATRPANLGQLADLARLEALVGEPGPIRFERVSAADWHVSRSGLINFDHPRAREAGIEDGPEAIEVFFYVLEHPVFGDYLVDSGVASGFQREGGNPDVSFLVESAMKTETLAIHTTTKDWLAKRDRPVSGVFLTHIHLDHVMGLPDLPGETKVYVGPGETEATGFLNLFTRGTIDRMLAGIGPLHVWSFAGPNSSGAPGETPNVNADPSPPTAPTPPTPPMLDVFGDGSLWAFHVPGHTPGSVAFLVRTAEGPRLLVGDNSHTRWGWENGVEPGTFTADHERNAESLRWLRTFAEGHPEMEVFLGHQR